MSNEKFCLKWNDFEKNISGAFRELKDDNDFFDVTLACDDEEQVSAHKVILSACSPLFKNLLRRNKHQHPLLYFRGVSFSDLESVLAFMYHGEVNVAQEDLNSFLAIAEDLKVKGLTQGNTERSKSPPGSSGGPSQKNSNVLSPHSLPKETKRPRHEPAKYDDEDDIQEVVPVKTEVGAMAIEEAKIDLATYDEESYEDYSGYDDQHYSGAGAMVHAQSGMEVSKGSITSPEDLYQYIERCEEGHRCTICSKVFTRRYEGRSHCESVHFPNYFEYKCEFCEESFKSKKTYFNHKQYKHKSY